VKKLHLFVSRYGSGYIHRTLRVNESLEKVREYADLVIEGMKTGKFLYLAHPEVVYYTGKDQAGWETEMRLICRCAKSLDIPLEVNFLGMHEKLQYPREDFWKIAGQEGCRAVFGIDAHTPEAVQWSKTVYGPAAALLMRNGVKQEETLPLPSGTF